MSDNQLSSPTVRLLRRLSIIIGSLMMIIAVFADTVGISAGGGISRNQVCFFITGAVLILAGVLGRRFMGFYRGAGVILLNVIVAVILLEIIAIIAVKLFANERILDRTLRLEHGHLAQIEHTVVIGKYAPFVVWRANPEIIDEGISVNRHGYRITPGASDDSSAYRVFLMGGSAMWGSNVPDNCTIGAYLQDDMLSRFEQPVAVFNMAQIGYSSTQEVIELVLQLRSGNVPDFVVFYDGFNDVWGAYESGRAGTHHSEGPIAARVEGRPEAFDVRAPLEGLLMESNTWLLVHSISERVSSRGTDVSMLETYRTMGVDKDSLASDVVETYIGNCRVVEALGDSYGFECLFIMQPSIWYGNKTHSTYECEILEAEVEFFLCGSDSAWRELYAATYDLFEETSGDLDRIVSLAHVFDGFSENVYNDYSGVHVEPWANDYLASELLDLMTEIDPDLIPAVDSLPE